MASDGSAAIRPDTIWQQVWMGKIWNFVGLKLEVEQS
jgi:hypothetical protein